MRIVRMPLTPLADRQGVRRSGAALIAVLVSVVLAFTPARATVVTVSLDVSALEPVASVPLAACEVGIEAGSDAVVVLEAARQTGCIESYQTSTHPEFGRFLECINGVCGTEVTYWRMTLDGEPTAFGIDGYEAAGGDVLGFSYTTWAGCLVDPSLC